jgi:hypothetical protein
MAKIDWVAPARHVPKPWGYEEHFALVPGRYCGKILHIRAGQAVSLQLHERKDETIAVHSGSRTAGLPRRRSPARPRIRHRA